jgi:acetyl-CoA synthetase
MIANYPSMEIRPGSMGKPLPGVEAAILRRSEGSIELIDQPDEEGELAFKLGWPSMFRGYLHEPERYANALPKIQVARTGISPGIWLAATPMVTSPS